MPQETFNYVDRTLLDIGDGRSSLTGKPVNSDTAYVYTLVPYPGRFTPSGKQIYGREFVKLSDILSAQAGITFVDRSLLDIGDARSSLTGQAVDTDATYVYTFAPYPGKFTPAGKQIYSREFVKLSDVLARQTGLAFINRSILYIGDTGSPVTGQPANNDTTYVYTLSPYAGMTTPAGKQIYGREFVKLTDIVGA